MNNDIRIYHAVFSGNRLVCSWTGKNAKRSAKRFQNESATFSLKRLSGKELKAFIK